MAATNDDPDEMITGINVTPLVDVVLVLLIVLMVTASYVVSQAIPVDLPQASTGESNAEPLAISIDAEGDVFLDGKRASDVQLRAGVRAAKQKNRDVRALIAADSDARHRHLVQVVDVLRQEGVPKFAINVQPKDLARGATSNN